MRITQAAMIQFCDTLIAKIWEQSPDADIELKQAPTGHFHVIIHSDNTLQCESECYTIDPISRDWIKTYGNF